MYHQNSHPFWVLCSVILIILREIWNVLVTLPVVTFSPHPPHFFISSLEKREKRKSHCLLLACSFILRTVTLLCRGAIRLWSQQISGLSDNLKTSSFGINVPFVHGKDFMLDHELSCRGFRSFWIIRVCSLHAYCQCLKLSFKQVLICNLLWSLIFPWKFDQFAEKCRSFEKN